MRHPYSSTVQVRTPAPDQIGLDIPIITDVGDAALSIFRSLPGSGWVETAIKNGATWLGEWAKTKLGFFTLQLISNTLYLPLSQAGIYLNTGNQLVIGPQLATVVFAIPGVIAGKSFVESYTTEMADRVVATIEFFAGKAAGEAAKEQGTKYASEFMGQVEQLEKNPDMKIAVDKVKGDLAQRGVEVAKEELTKAGISPEQLAQKFGVRADAAAAALNAYFQKHIYRIGDPRPFGGVITEDYDIYGNRIPPASPTFPANFSSAVVHAQQTLKGLGILSVPVTTGVLDEPTKRALRTFQVAQGLPMTGDLDSRTDAVLLDVLRKSARPTPVPYPDEALGKLLGTAILFAPNTAPLVQQQLQRLGAGLPLDPVVLSAIAQQVRASGRPEAFTSADQIDGVASQVRASSSKASGGLISQLFTVALLTAPLWGTVLLLRRYPSITR